MKEYRFVPSKIREIREANGISVKEVVLLEIARHKSQLDQWEMGLVTPSAKKIAEFATLFGVSPNDFFHIT